jgi:hypothetical protein
LIKKKRGKNLPGENDPKNPHIMLEKMLDIKK